MSAAIREALRSGYRPILVALAAGALYGSWAAFVNCGAGVVMALRAGVTQAVLSTITTLMLALVLERLFRWSRTAIRGFWVASLGTAGLAATAVAIVHAVAGTPHIAVTIAPSVAVGTAFCFLYARAILARARSVVS